MARGRSSARASSEAMHEKVIPWLQRQGDEPFFLYLHTIDPHTPYAPPPEQRDRFDPNYEGPFRDLELSNAKINQLLKSRGIEQIFYFQVDNPLVDIADPVFLGYHAREGAEMSTKVVPKRDEVVTEVEALKVDIVEGESVTVEIFGTQWVDGLRIYEVPSFAIRVRSGA